MHRNRCAFCRFLALSGIQLEVKIMSWQQYATMIIMIKIRNNDQPDNNSHLEKFGETTANSRSYQIWGFLELGTPKKNIAFRIRPKNGQEFRSHKKMIIFSVPRWIDHSRYGNQTCWPLDNPPPQKKIRRFLIHRAIGLPPVLKCSKPPSVWLRGLTTRKAPVIVSHGSGDPKLKGPKNPVVLITGLRKA